MTTSSTPGAFILGAFLCAGLIGLGYLGSSGFLEGKALERTVTVKGLSEREVPTDIAIWPIRFSEADNDLVSLYARIERDNTLVTDFLLEHGFTAEEISVSAPAITDRQAQSYGDGGGVLFRYVATSAITVYTTKTDQVRATQTRLVDLGKQGVVISGDDYQARTQFLFTGLNDIKPDMIEEATRNAREVAGKFAADSASLLGRIKTASQGQFSIDDRDSNTPYIKKVRVVSTVEYYLTD